MKPEEPAGKVSREAHNVKCPGGFACYTDAEDAAIARRLLYSKKLTRWADNVETDCGEPEVPE